MLGSLLPQLATLIVTVRKNMLSSLMTTLMIILIIVAWSARGNLATWLINNPTASEQSERIERGRQSDINIDKTLRIDLQRTNADRLGIRQYSDQIDSHSSVRVPYVTTTHIVAAPGVSLPTPQMTNMPRSYMADVTNKIYENPNEPRCVHMAASEVRDEIYHGYLTDIGVFDMYICPITDLNGTPIGIIGASYLTPTKPHPTDEQMFAILSNTATRVAGYLAEVNEPERKTWIQQLLNS